MKMILAAFIISLSGCTSWTERYVPTTAEERVKVEQLETKLLSNIPSTLAGHDQDWDDAIATAHQVACRTVCRPTYWEYFREYTGRWRYADSLETGGKQ